MTAVRMFFPRRENAPLFFGSEQIRMLIALSETNRGNWPVDENIEPDAAPERF